MLTRQQLPPTPQIRRALAYPNTSRCSVTVVAPTPFHMGASSVVPHIPQHPTLVIRPVHTRRGPPLTSAKGMPSRDMMVMRTMGILAKISKTVGHFSTRRTASRQRRTLIGTMGDDHLASRVPTRVANRAVCTATGIREHRGVEMGEY